ncbi:MAG TPA: PilN domain-containing protein [Tahibacter sp.]|uniref:PilN domain-containing protein n=1 Tax=Tahibacter sp. TaxID=2056211 RepID=UPI002C64F313|nr:PilN domain-containing protein [Tahibacter sp.]HSX61135.1 PilN domain-containing protein [Tahibacter sp.]
MAIQDVLEPQLVRLRARYAKTPLPRFFAWWGGELLSFLPATWRAALAEGRESLLLHVADSQLVLRRETARGATDFGQIDLTQDVDVQRGDFQRLRARIDEPQLRQFFCVPTTRVLRRSLNLPAAAEDNLRQVLGFEMDRQTPFKADQVYFDYVVRGRDAAGRQLQVDLVVMPRAAFDEEISPVAQLGIPLDGVDCWIDGASGTRMGVNLLPPDRRARRSNQRLWLNLGLAALVVILALGVMARTVTNRQAALENMTAEVEKAQQEAKQVAGLRKTLEETIESANFLTQKKRTVVPAIELLKDLTERLPDSTYLERLNVTEDGRVELQGLSDRSEGLIAELQKSKVLGEPAFQGVVQPDPRVKKDRFNLVAQLKPREAEPAKPGKAAKDGGDAKDAPAEPAAGKDAAAAEAKEGSANAPAAAKE